MGFQDRKPFKGMPSQPNAKAGGLNKKDARQTLTAKDYTALPFLKKKDPETGMWMEDKLVQHIINRLRLSDNERRIRVMRMQDIDIQLSGMVHHDKDDRKRDRDNKRGKAPAATKVNLTLAYTQLDDCVTYLMSLYAPETNIFTATSTADKQNVAEGLTKEVGNQGQKLQYFRHLAKFCLNAVKYNLGGMSINWEKQNGTVFQKDPNNSAVSGAVKKVQGVVWQGNVLKSLDMYNFLYDTSVHPVDLPSKGEYFAEVEPITPFRVQRMADQQILFGVNRFIDFPAPLYGSDSGTFYMAPPIVREPSAYTDKQEGGAVNWQMILTPGGPAKDSQPGIELCWYTTWLYPYKFGLSNSQNMELWRLCMANGKYIAASTKLDDSHGQLPCACGTPIEDDLRNDQRTYAEQLLPLQMFASFLLNTHVDATRKAIYGITVFDQNLFPGFDLSTEDLIGARVPMKSSATGIDIDKAFRHYNDAPQTDQNVEMVGKIVDLMQKILPTNQAQQVADLERATEYQAAATVQASSRRNLKIARLLNDQALSIVKFQMLYNIYENMPAITYVDSQGKDQTITPANLLDAQIEFDVGTGLKGLDRLMQISIFKDILGYVFQIKDAATQFDVLGLLTYMAEIAGFQTDLTQFKLQPQQVQQNVDTQVPTSDKQPQQGAPNGAAPPAGPQAPTP